MADNCSVLDPRTYRPDSASAWLREASALENAALTRALQMSLSDTTTTTTATATTSSASAADTLSSSFLLPPHRQLTPSSSASSSPAAGAAALRPSPARRISKRKSRANKRSATTYIKTDPANFREMVQQVTGVAGKPPARATVGSARPTAALEQICLPTLDTSAMLLGGGEIGASRRDGFSGQQPPAPAPASQPVDALGFDFDYLLPAFPTLDSWAGL